MDQDRGVIAMVCTSTPAGKGDIIPGVPDIALANAWACVEQLKPQRYALAIQ